MFLEEACCDDEFSIIGLLMTENSGHNMGYVLARNFLSGDELFNNGIIVYHDTLIDLHNVYVCRLFGPKYFM